MVSRAAALVLGLCACVLSAGSARAHAPPQVLDVVWTDQGDVLIVTNRGLIFGTPAEHRFRLLCNEALHITVTDIPSAMLLPDGRVLAAAYSGLIATSDEGCTWQRVGPLGAMQTTSLAAEVGGGSRIFVSSYAPGEGGVWRSDDGAATFVRVLDVDDVDYVRSLRVSRPDQGEVTVYASGSMLDDDGQYVHYVARSRDSGESWERFAVPVLESELDVTLLAVSPTDPSLIVAKATSVEPLTIAERLLISRDGGETFSSSFELTSLAHAELSADGATLWVAGLGGLFRSDDFETFERVAETEAMTYVSEHDGQLFVSGRYAGLLDAANGIAILDGAESALEPFMELRDVSEAVSCELGTETEYLCQTAWTDWHREVLASNASSDAGIVDANDAGEAPDAGTDASAHPEVSLGRTRASSCAASPGNDTHAPILLAGTVLLIVFWGRRWKA